MRVRVSGWPTTPARVKTDLTSKIKTHFEDQERDTPDLKPPFGAAGWMENDSQVVLYDQFDLWSISLADLSAKI